MRTVKTLWQTGRMPRLGLRWTHRSFCWFCHEAAQISKSSFNKWHFVWLANQAWLISQLKISAHNNPRSFLLKIKKRIGWLRGELLGYMNYKWGCLRVLTALHATWSSVYLGFVKHPSNQLITESAAVKLQGLLKMHDAWTNHKEKLVKLHFNNRC